MTHEFIDLNFQGVTKTACKHCSCLSDSPQANEDCQVRQYEQLKATLPVMQPKTADALQWVKTLDSTAIGERIQELEGELAALRVLQQAADAKDKATVKKAKK